MIANAVKGEVAVQTAAGSLVLCFSWPGQKAIGRRLGKPFRQAVADFETLGDEELGFIWWVALQHHQPEITEERADALISELGFNACMKLVAESIALAYDMGPAAAAAGPRTARGKASTKTPASSSGSASA